MEATTITSQNLKKLRFTLAKDAESNRPSSSAGAIVGVSLRVAKSADYSAAIPKRITRVGFSITKKMYRNQYLSCLIF